MSRSTRESQEGRRAASLPQIVSAEFVASRAGIGYLIWTSWQILVVENMFVGIIAITFLGVGSTFLLKEAERYFIPWRQEDTR